MSDDAVRVVLADDQRLVRESLATLLGLLDGIELLATASDGEEALALTAEHDPDYRELGHFPTEQMARDFSYSIETSDEN